MSKGGGGNQQKQGFSFNIGLPDFSSPGPVANLLKTLIVGAIACGGALLLGPSVDRGAKALSKLGNRAAGTKFDESAFGASGSGGGEGGGDDALGAAHKRIGETQGQVKGLQGRVDNLQKKVDEIAAAKQ